MDLNQLIAEYESKKDSYSPEKQAQIEWLIQQAQAKYWNQKVSVTWWYMDAQGNRREEYSDGTTKMVEAAPKKVSAPVATKTPVKKQTNVNNNNNNKNNNSNPTHWPLDTMPDYMDWIWDPNTPNYEENPEFYNQHANKVYSDYAQLVADRAPQWTIDNFLLNNKYLNTLVEKNDNRTVYNIRNALKNWWMTDEQINDFTQRYFDAKFRPNPFSNSKTATVLPNWWIQFWRVSL